MKIRGAKCKEPAMKEINNLDMKNECFGEKDKESLTQEMKNQKLPLIILTAMKRSGNLKPRGCTNGSYQKICTKKRKCSSTTPDVFSLKHSCGATSKEARAIAIVGLPGFFLQTKRDDEEQLLLKVTGAVDFLLVESDPTK